jgi:hypothetical protein
MRDICLRKTRDEDARVDVVPSRSFSRAPTHLRPLIKRSGEGGAVFKENLGLIEEGIECFGILGLDGNFLERI